MNRPCLTCGRPSRTSRCNRCRGSATARGYGVEHQRAADQDPEWVNATHCTNCGQPFTAGNPKQRGHETALRTGAPDTGRRLPHCRDCNAGWRRTGL